MTASTTVSCLDVKLAAIAEALELLDAPAIDRVLASLVYEVNRFTGDQLHYQDCYNYSHVAPQLHKVENLKDSTITNEVYKLGARNELVRNLGVLLEESESV